MRSDERAVSSVMGTSLMMLVTVSVFAGLGVAVYGELETAEAPPVADLRPLVRDDQVLLQHRGGEPIDLSMGTVRIQVGGAFIEQPLSDWASDTADGRTWRAGDTLCISCAYPGQTIDAAEVVVANALMLRHGSLGDRSAAPSQGPSLGVGSITMDPAVPHPGDIVTITGTTVNEGAAPSAPATTRFIVNSVVIGSNATPALGPGALQEAAQAWTATAGTHTIKLTVDQNGTMASKSLMVTVSTAPAPPSTAFIDRDGDGVFTPGTDTNLTGEAAAQLRAGSFDDEDADLVLPPSFGPIDVDGKITFKARSITLGVNLAASDDVNLDVEDTLAVQNVSILAGGHVKLELDDATGVATIRGSVVQATKKIDINVEDADLIITNTTLSSSYKMDIQSDGHLDLANSTITAAKYVFIRSSDEDINLNGANITTVYPVFIEVPHGRTIHIQDAILDDDDDIVRIGSKHANVVGTPAFGGWSY